jgi:hypothetical protein
MSTFNAADALNVENEYWALSELSLKPCTRCITNAVVGKLKDLRSTPLLSPGEVNLTRLTSKGCIVRHQLDVQKAKLAARSLQKNDGSRYFTGENEICTELIRFHDRLFRLSLTYTGAPHIQTGNCVLRGDGQQYGLHYGIHINKAAAPNHINDPEVMLLMLIEVSRRKAVDPHRRNLSDVFFNVPAALGVAMAERLALDGHILYDHFWCKWNQKKYHFFTGNDRLDAFTRLGTKYVTVYLPKTSAQQKIVHFRDLMQEHYGQLALPFNHDLCDSIGLDELYI